MTESAMPSKTERLRRWVIAAGPCGGSQQFFGVLNVSGGRPEVTVVAGAPENERVMSVVCKWRDGSGFGGVRSGRLNQRAVTGSEATDAMWVNWRCGGGSPPAPVPPSSWRRLLPLRPDLSLLIQLMLDQHADVAAAFTRVDNSPMMAGVWAVS
jgi:hypothetical protein